LLKKGGQLLLKGSGDSEAKTVSIADVRHEDKTLRVYNLEVANAHTYFVGNDGVNVHNISPPPGWTKISERSHGQPVYKNGQYYISPDVDGHNGGVWKMCKGSPKNLRNRSTRMGTYDANLNRIGD
ncbi:MAG TPA: toxin C-terminal domain-containing protein, partial [Nitrosomonas sp.]|nr:toxin C-terminal domain-containing protein [Nitrosomonas sp.]